LTRQHHRLIFGNALEKIDEKMRIYTVLDDHNKSKRRGMPPHELFGIRVVDSEQILEPYDQILTVEKINELLPQVIEVLKNFEIVIYYRGGARKTYLELIEQASRITGTHLVVFGYANMGDINKLEEIINSVKHTSKKRNYKSTDKRP